MAMVGGRIHRLLTEADIIIDTESSASASFDGVMVNEAPEPSILSGFSMLGTI